MAGIFRFWWRVVSRAWLDTWSAVVSTSPRAIVRDAAVLSATLVFLYLINDWLVDQGVMSSDNTKDTVVYLAIGLTIVACFFANVFLIQAIFIVPHKLWREENEARTAAEESLLLSSSNYFYTPDTIHTSPLFAHFRARLSPEYSSFNPETLVNEGIKSLGDVYRRALDGDSEAYLIASDVASWLSKASRRYYASSARNYEIQCYVTAVLDEIYKFKSGQSTADSLGSLTSPPLSSGDGEVMHPWATDKTRFYIWEAACYITDVPITLYSQSDKARAMASELLYYAKEGYINLAGEDDHSRKRRTSLNRSSLEFDENTFLGRETVEKIKDNGLNSWLPIVDKINKERRGM